MTEQTINKYNEQASSYEARWKAYLEHTHEAFLRNIETSETDTILDISGGTGLLAEMLIARGYPFEQLVINDPSVQMLDIARSRLSGESNIRFTNYRAEQLRFEANRFDRIFCLNSFHFYTDQQDVLNRCHTLLKPGGTLCILDWNRAGFFRIINRILKWSTSENIDSRSFDEMKELVGNAGLDVRTADSWRWRYWKFYFVEAGK